MVADTYHKKKKKGSIKIQWSIDGFHGVTILVLATCNALLYGPTTCASYRNENKKTKADTHAISIFRVIFIKRAYTRESNRTDVSRRHTSISQVIMAARTRPIPSTNRNKTYYHLVPALIDAVCCAVFLSFIGIYLRRRLFIFIFRENWVVSDHCAVLLGFRLTNSWRTWSVRTGNAAP